MKIHHTAMRLYRLALKLYPAPFRSEFGEEMVEVFGRAARNASGRGRWPLLRLILREMAGILAGSVRERATREALAATALGHAAPLAAGLAVAGVFFLGILFAGGAFIFQPLLYLFVLAALVLGSIEAGRLQAEGRPLGRRLFRTGLALFVVMAAVPAARLADHLWLGELARTGGDVEYSLPGIDIRAVPVTVGSGSATTSIKWNEILPADRHGLIHSGSRPGATGRRLVTVWHRRPSSPPYELLIPLLAGSLALAAHAARRRRTPMVSA